MARAMFIGGFGASEEMLDPVGRALEKHFEQVDVISLRYAEGSPDAVKVMAKDADVFAHSAGIGPTANTCPAALHGLGAALPRSRFALILNTAAKQRRMHREDPEKARDFERSAATLAFFDDDAYFQLSERDEAWAENSSLKVLHLPGQHDELILNPQQTIDLYLQIAG